MNSENNEITIWLEQYKQVNDNIRNYRTIHWQIASVLYILMGAIIGYGVPNVADGWGKGLVCFSTFLIFTLHVSTYFYFRRLEKIKDGKLKEIKTKINKIINQDNETINDGNPKDCFLENKHIPMSCFWQCHPYWGFFIIFISLAVLAGAFWNFPKNP